MNCITLLPSSKSLVDNTNSNCPTSIMNNTRYSALLISFKVDPYFTVDQLLSQFYLIFKNPKNLIIPVNGLSLDISLNKSNGNSKTQSISNPEINKQGCYLSINCTPSFNEDDFEGVENISILIKSSNFSNADYCSLFNMAVVCRLCFNINQLRPIPINLLENQCILEMTRFLESIVNEDIAITTLDCTLNQYLGVLKDVTPYYIVLKNHSLTEIIPINKITAVCAPGIGCYDLNPPNSDSLIKDCCFKSKLEDLKGKKLRIQLQGLGEETNSLDCKVREVSLGLCKVKSQRDYYIINNFYISRIINGCDCCLKTNNFEEDEF